MIRNHWHAGREAWNLEDVSHVIIITVDMINDDVTKWKHFPRYWPFVRGIHRSPVNSPHKGQEALMFSLICARINGWVNNREAGDLRRHRAHYDVIVMDSVNIWGVHPCRNTFLCMCMIYKDALFKIPTLYLFLWKAISIMFWVTYFFLHY